MTEETKNMKPRVFVGEYAMGEDIGHGTFSKVRMGVHKLTGEKVAIKVIKKANLLEADDLIRVKREIDILNNLKHVNIIRAFNIREDEYRYYIMMEYCGGGELFNYIVKHKRLDEETCAFFFYQLINGLEVIHKYNIAHRDLKPENVLLTDNKLLKIIDFGLSNSYKDGNLLSTPCGSPCYASPEMVAGKEYNGFMIDIWSSGIVLYAMVCGFLPFEDVDNESLFAKILACKVHYPTFMPANVKDILKKMLVTDPEVRIKIHEIKQHPFYNQGRYLFNKAFPNKPVSEIKFKLNHTVENTASEGPGNLAAHKGFNKRALFHKTFLNQVNGKRNGSLLKESAIKHIFLSPDVRTGNTSIDIGGNILTSHNSTGVGNNNILFNTHGTSTTFHSKRSSAMNSKQNFIKIINASTFKPKKIGANITTNDFITTYLNTSVEGKYTKTEESKQKVHHTLRKVDAAKLGKFINDNNEKGRALPKVNFKHSVSDGLDFAKMYLNSSKVNKLKKPVNKLNVYNVASLKLKESLKSALYINKL
jgi:serine/threonine protein kinase